MQNYHNKFDILYLNIFILPYYLAKRAHVCLCDDVRPIRIKAHACISENKIKQIGYLKKNPQKVWTKVWAFIPGFVPKQYKPIDNCVLTI